MSSGYLSFAFRELFNEDGLCVMARGCGINKLLAKFVQYYSYGTVESHASQEEKKKLVFVLNLAGQEQVILDHLLADGIPPHRLPRVITSENVSAQERADLFRRGGCYIITSRLLVVDLLDKKLPAQNILGMLVANAHKITETSLETFILRVYRESHRGGFVKAFSEDPESFTGAFAKIDRIMRMLWLQKLYLWPRFHESIVGALDQCQPEVIEIQQPLSNSMKTVQSALLVALSTAINELKRAAPTLDSAFMTLDNGLGVGFDHMVRNQLEPEWHRLSARTRQLVADIRSLRGLLEYLIRYDSLTFYYHLLRLRADSLARDTFSPSLWLSSDAAEIIFRCSKDRVFAVEELKSRDADSGKDIEKNKKKVASAPTASSSLALPPAAEELSAVFDLKHKMACTMECPPKWSLLLDTVLPEISSEQ
jgi:DNA excision repair protein ERCC-4